MAEQIIDGQGNGYPMKVNSDGSANINIYQTYATRAVESGNYIFFGIAQAGTNGSSSTWQVKRIYSSGTDTEINFADGNPNFDNVWNNYLNLDYS